MGARSHPRRHDAEQQTYRRSASIIGWQVAAVCAALVVVGGAVILGFVFWQTTPVEANRPPQPNEIEVRLDPAELMLAGVLLALGAVLSAGVAARLIARRAVRPLDEAFQLQRRFVADVSHELRTPLAVLNARSQQLVALLPRDDPRGPVLAELREDVRIMSAVVDEMLEAATGGRAGDATTSAFGEPAASVFGGTTASASDVETASASRVVAAVIRDMSALASEFGVTLRGTAPEATVEMPEGALRRGLIGVIDNAIDHSPAGGVVEVRATLEEASLVISIRDEGSGITGIAPERVFERFAHGSPPTTPRGGTRQQRGIGLALVRELCDTHRASVRLVSTGSNGSEFAFTLPVRQGGTR